MSWTRAGLELELQLLVMDSMSWIDWDARPDSTACGLDTHYGEYWPWHVSVQFQYLTPGKCRCSCPNETVRHEVIAAMDQQLVTATSYYQIETRHGLSFQSNLN